MFVTLKEYNARLSVCSGCDKYNHTLKTCGVCGCFMPLKAGASMMTCPDNKWGESDSREKIDPGEDYEV